MRIAICPGSFDPVTLGHVELILRAYNLFDKIIVLVLTNSEKKYMFSKEKRVDFLNKVFSNYKNIEVDSFEGLLVDYAKSKGVIAVIKGIRSVTDFDYEKNMALINKKLNSDLETLFLVSCPDKICISSSMVKQIAGLGGDISSFVPKSIYKDIMCFFEREENSNEY